MGTRGFIGFVIDNEVKITYNHFDSYPGGLGVATLAAVRELAKDPIALTEAARALKLVNEEDIPTAEDIARLRQYHNDQVSTGSVTEWYSLMRNIQGEIAEYLKAGFMIDNHGFALDSLFCEWGYLVNIDSRAETATFEVYRGFQKQRPQRGLWAGRPTVKEQDEDRAEYQRALDAGEITQGQFDYFTNREYYAVEQVGSWPLNELPSDDALMAIKDEED